MTVFCRSCRKEKEFNQCWWELRRDASEGSVRIIHFQYYWSDRDAQFCSRKCLFEHLENYCKRAEASSDAFSIPTHSRALPVESI